MSSQEFFNNCHGMSRTVKTVKNCQDLFPSTAVRLAGEWQLMQWKHKVSKGAALS